MKRRGIIISAALAVGLLAGGWFFVFKVSESPRQWPRAYAALTKVIGEPKPFIPSVVVNRTPPMATVPVDSLTPTDAHRKLYGAFYAASALDPDALGGYAASGNLPRKLAASDWPAATDLALVALPADTVPYGDGLQGMRVVLLNRRSGAVIFNASDSRLAIVQQAKDASGTWQDIEELPSSWCGNSYHRLFLHSGYYWEFAVPRYSGTVDTELRFIFHGLKTPLISNVFTGSVNPEQFQAPPPYQATSLMDPYGN